MTKDVEQQQMFTEDGSAEHPMAGMLEFYQDVGKEVVGVDRMFKKTTETRPFIYECRFDLWPANASRGLCVLKGFGESGGLISFQDGAGIVGMVRGLYGRMMSGKLHFSEDKFPPGNYEKRVGAFLKEQEYLATKLPSR